MADLYTLPNATSGLDAIVVDTVEAVPSLIPLLFLFVFFVVALGGIARQKARTGTADYPMWFVIASLSVFMLALITSTTTGLIHLDWLIIIVVVLLFSGVWLFLDRRSSEI